MTNLYHIEIEYTMANSYHKGNNKITEQSFKGKVKTHINI